jgi:hypothetical protein
MNNWFNIFPLALIFIGCITFLISKRIVMVLVSVGMITFMEFLIGIQFNSFSSALIRLLANLATVSAIYLSVYRIKNYTNTLSRNSSIFRIIAFLILVVFSIIIGIKISSYLQVPLEIIDGGILVLFCGILQLGISTMPLKVILSLVLFFSGFMTIYTFIEISILVNGLMAVIILLLGGLGTYFAVKEKRF